MLVHRRIMRSLGVAQGIRKAHISHTALVRRYYYPRNSISAPSAGSCSHEERIRAFESRSKGLLIGGGMEKSTLEGVRAIVRADPAVERVDKLLIMYLGPEDVLLAIELRFHSNTTTIDIRRAVARLHQAIQERYPGIRRIFLDSTAIRD